jgi:hypothetical protein
MATGLINGVNYSWADVKLVLFGVPVIGITHIEYGVKQEKKNNYGMGTKVVSRGYGNEEPTAKITVYKDFWMSVIMQAPGYNPNYIPPFDIQVVYGSSRVAAHLDILASAEFTDDALKVAQGDTKILIEIPLIIADVIHKY